MSGEKVRIKSIVETGFSGCVHEEYHEYDREEWDAMSEQEQQELLEELATTFRDNMVSCNAWVIQ